MMSASTRAVVTAASAALVSLTVFVDSSLGWNGWLPLPLLAIGIVIFAMGWPRLLAVPARYGAAIVIAGSGLAALIAVATTGHMEPLALVMAGGVIGSFVHQMMRSDGRPRLVESVSATTAGVVAAVGSAGWIAIITRPNLPLAGQHPRPTALIVLAACILAVAALAVALTPQWLTWSLVPILGAVLGGGLGAIFPTVGWIAGTSLGFCLAVFTVGLHVLFDIFPASRRIRPALAAALLPVLASGVIVYTIARVIATVTV